MPECRRFGPLGEEHPGRSPVVMTVDEFEAIRLIDLLGMTQEQCALQMDVARTTAQAIYGSARAKAAECLVHGRELQILGGEYVLCEEEAGQCGCGRACPKRCGRETQINRQQGGAQGMKIAVTYENGQVFQHFGHTERFKVYSVENGSIAEAAVVNTNGSGHGALADILKKLGVDTLICGGIGGGARRALDEAGVAVYGGVTGDADRAAADFLSGKLSYDPAAMCLIVCE